MVEKLRGHFPEVEIRTVKGNHAGNHEWLLWHSIEQYFRDKVRVINARTRWHTFQERNSMIILDHGDSDQYANSKTPNQGGARTEAYVQTLILRELPKMPMVTSKIYIQGDLHHYEHKEFADFEYFLFGSTMKGSRFADHHNLSSRPRQNALLLDDKGVKQQLHFYFD
jgi:hypothetical protein